VPVSRRTQILDTAAELFAERGFHGVSVHDIGAASSRSIITGRSVASGRDHGSPAA